MYEEFDVGDGRSCILFHWWSFEILEDLSTFEMLKDLSTFEILEDLSTFEILEDLSTFEILEDLSTFDNNTLIFSVTYYWLIKKVSDE